jgi:DNA transformation protein
MSPNSARDLAKKIAERIDPLARVSVSRFFGGAGLGADGVQFGFVMKGSLYLRVDDENRAAYEARGSAPFTYAGRENTVTVASYYETPSEVVDEPDVLGRWAAEAHRAALAAHRHGKSLRKGRPGATGKGMS